MPAADAFLDSNVLVYALSSAPEERRFRECAAHLIGNENFGTSYQVIMETWVFSTRKMALPVKRERAASFLEKILVFPFVHASAALYRQAVRLEQRYGIHPYDAAIIAAAHELGASVVYSEDMNDGQMYDDVRVVNPFKNLVRQ